MEVLEMLRTTLHCQESLGHVSFSESTWLREPALQIGFLMASGRAYIHTIHSHLASCEYERSSQTYMRSSRWKFATLALRTCCEASCATRIVFFAAHHRLVLHAVTVYPRSLAF